LLNLNFEKLTLLRNILIHISGNIPEFVVKFFVDTMSFGFLLPGKVLEETSAMIALKKMIIFDSILLPICFYFLLITTFKKRNELVATVVILPLITYYGIYYFYENGLGYHYPYSFRTSLPFHFLFIIFVPYLLELFRSNKKDAE